MYLTMFNELDMFSLKDVENERDKITMFIEGLNLGLLIWLGPRVR